MPALPIIVSGVALGFAAVHKAGVDHLSDDHMRWGLAIFVLYFCQLILGEFIHIVKPRSWTVDKRRPPQNYFHAVFGLLIIALAFYQASLSAVTAFRLIAEDVMFTLFRCELASELSGRNRPDATP